MFHYGRKFPLNGPDRQPKLPRPYGAEISDWLDHEPDVLELMLFESGDIDALLNRNR